MKTLLAFLFLSTLGLAQGTTLNGPVTILPAPGQSPTSSIQVTAATASQPCPAGIATPSSYVICPQDKQITVDFGDGNGYVNNNGNAATVTIGTVTTLPAGSSATVTNSGNASQAVLDFGIPQGSQGIEGSTPTVGVGTVSTLPAGSAATVTNSGTSQNAVFNFGIPQGLQGIQGLKGTMPSSCSFTMTFTNGSKTKGTITFTPGTCK